MADEIQRLSRALETCDAVVIGAGAGLSTAAGYTYSGERFDRYFSDFEKTCGFHDMYSGGFFPFPTRERFWAFWSRQIWVNRYAPIPNDTYDDLLHLVHDKDYFIITTNVDHCFQRAGLNKERLFYMQGDFGLFQCPLPCTDETWDNYDEIKAMVLAQGFEIADDGTLLLPKDGNVSMEIPSELIPHCPHCGREATTNLRIDSSFVEDKGWHEASRRYSDFLATRNGNDEKVLFWELGVGYNTPVIIKYPFWQMTAKNENATYACINMGEVQVPEQIADRSILIDGDIRAALKQLQK